MNQLDPCHIYEGPGDDLAEQIESSTRIVLLPDAPVVQKEPDQIEHIRIMWGQRLIDDLLACRYRAVVCAVNPVDNSHGILNLLAQRLPTSQWTEPAITEHARRFVQKHTVAVIKYDMDVVQVLAILRPAEHEHLTLSDLSSAFRMISAMLRNRPDRLPVASVCFLGARVNRLLDANGQQPSLETVLRIMYEAGFRGDVYPAPVMWQSAPAAVFPRYPFPESFKQMCRGGY